MPGSATYILSGCTRLQGKWRKCPVRVGAEGQQGDPRKHHVMERTHLSVWVVVVVVVVGVASVCIEVRRCRLVRADCRERAKAGFFL